jgi:hypothetical protein
MAKYQSAMVPANPAEAKIKTACLNPPEIESKFTPPFRLGHVYGTFTQIKAIVQFTTNQSCAVPHATGPDRPSHLPEHIAVQPATGRAVKAAVGRYERQEWSKT